MASCKYGFLKHPVGRRRCKVKPGTRRRRTARGRYRGRYRSRGRGVRCRFGRLKYPQGNRICRRVRPPKPFHRRKGGRLQWRRYYRGGKIKEGPLRQDGSY